jgi:hypothetical protein
VFDDLQYYEISFGFPGITRNIKRHTLQIVMSQLMDIMEARSTVQTGTW